MSKAHGHFFLDRDDKQDGTFTIELQVMEGHDHDLRGYPSIAKVCELLADVVKSGAGPRRGLISATYSLDLARWMPTIALPFLLPSAGESIPGLPKISGLDFSFGEHSEKQPLQRAFMTVYEPIGRLVVRLLLRAGIELDTSLPVAIVESVHQQLPAFARLRGDT